MIHLDGHLVEDWPKVVEAAELADEMGIEPIFDEVEYGNLPIEWWMEYEAMIPPLQMEGWSYG